MSYNLVWVAALAFSYLKIQCAKQPQVGHKFHFWWSQFWNLNIYWRHTHSKFNSKWPSQAMTHHFLPAHSDLPHIATYKLRSQFWKAYFEANPLFLTTSPLQLVMLYGRSLCQTLREKSRKIKLKSSENFQCS